MYLCVQSVDRKFHFVPKDVVRSTPGKMCVWKESFVEPRFTLLQQIMHAMCVFLPVNKYHGLIGNGILNHGQLFGFLSLNEHGFG